MARKRKKKNSGRTLKTTAARRADKYVCYEKSVQEPEADVPFLNRVFRNHNGRPPRKLREDFCGTAAMACHWVESNAQNEAVGIDLDPVPLEWGHKHHVAGLRPDQAARIKLIEGNVLDVASNEMDVTIAYNFSYFIFRERKEMLRYFKQARTTLTDGGIFVLDVYGGPDAQRSLKESRRGDKNFRYVWEQHSFDPIQNRGVNYIHFEFKDKSTLKRAFKYEWRIWSIPELRDILEDAGFSLTEVYWEGTDRETGDGNSVFIRRERAEDDPAWISYIVAVR